VPDTASLRVLIAPSGFKESLSAEEAAAAIEEGVLRVLPDARTTCLPMADGGEGFTRTLVAAAGGEVVDVEVTGPIGEPVASHFGRLDDGAGTRVLEMAAAAGLRLVPRDRRDPFETTTYGVGELARAALDDGAERILLGCGDSGTNDAGAGFAQALGVRLLDADGNDIGRGGRSLIDLAAIDLDGRDPRLDEVPIDVACNMTNVLCGPKGVARVFGPQKGASPETVERMEEALAHFADIVERDVGMDVRTIDGGGASGGLGAGIHALCGARLRHRFEIVRERLDFDALLARADLVLTAEGAVDFQTPNGKIPSEVAHAAHEHGIPVIAIAGTLGRQARVNLHEDIDAMVSAMDAPMDLETAINEAERLVRNAADGVMRLVVVGAQLGAAGKLAT
jgi:glycerate 2-kinase